VVETLVKMGGVNRFGGFGGSKVLFLLHDLI
jgi:hypothetical protein